MYKKIVVFGGGTGISYLLRGLKDFPVDITAVIAVSDNGRSTGKLRKEFHTPAVGDIRKVITNLSQIDEPIKDMMSYRFKTSSDLDGHAVGNLILTAMLDITGSLKEAIASLSKILDVRHFIRDEETKLGTVPMSRISYLLQYYERQRAICKKNRNCAKLFQYHVERFKNRKYMKVIDKITNSKYKYRRLSKEYLEDYTKGITKERK